MTIAQNTTIQAYQLRKGGTPARMAILRMIAADSVNNRNPHTRLQPGDWRGARSYTLKSYADAYVHGLYAGADGTWYTHGGGHFRNERYADECQGGPDHRGWYTNADGVTSRDGSGLARGIVGRLTHGRFIAGYWWGDNDERVYFPEVFTDEADAANMADEHARVFAEACRDDCARADEARELADATEDALIRLRECLALRHRACMAYVRDEIHELVETIKANRDRLTGEFADYV